MDEDGTELQTVDMVAGVLPVYSDGTPTKAADETSGFVFDGWLPDIGTATEDTTYTASYKRAYPITVDPAMEHGSIRVSDAYAAADAIVSLEPFADNGYEFDSISARVADGTAVPVTENEYYEGMYQLTMPGQPVTVSAVFVPEPEEVPEFGPASFILPAALTTIEKSAFEGNPMMTIVDANHCTSIGKDAFKDCAKLTQIKLPENCQIDPEAFDHPVYVFVPADGLTKECCDAQNNLIFVEIPAT